MINEKLCLVECKKTYVIEKNRYDFLVSTLLNYFQHWMKHQTLHFALFIAPEKEEKKLKEYKKAISEGCNTFYKQLLNGKIPENPYILEIENEKILHIEKKMPGLFENVTRTIKGSYSFLNVFAPPNGIQKDKNFYQFHFGISTAFSEDEALKNFIQKLENKRKQHKEIKDITKIFFFDNERLYFGESEPIPESLLSSPRINNYLSERGIKDLIVITTRIYEKDKPANCRLDIFYSDKNEEIASVLKKLKIFSNTY